MNRRVRYTGVIRMAKDEKAYKYDQDYIKANLIKILITYNRKKPDDMAELEWLNAQEEGKSAYIKRLIREDHAKHAPAE